MNYKKHLWTLAILAAAFVCKFTLPPPAWGQTIEWTRQFGSGTFDQAFGVAAGASGVYVAGRTFGALPFQTSAGDEDAFVRKYDLNGTELWTRQFGSAIHDQAFGVAADTSGVYMGGTTFGALPDQTRSEERRVGKECRL